METNELDFCAMAILPLLTNDNEHITTSIDLAYEHAQTCIRIRKSIEGVTSKSPYVKDISHGCYGDIWDYLKLHVKNHNDGNFTAEEVGIMVINLINTTDKIDAGIEIK